MSWCPSYGWDGLLRHGQLAPVEPTVPVRTGHGRDPRQESVSGQSAVGDHGKQGQPVGPVSGKFEDVVEPPQP